MFGKILIAFSALVAIANAGLIVGHGADAATVSVKQDTLGFGYKVDEVNTRAVVAPAVVKTIAAPLAYAAPAPLAYAAAPAPLAYAHPAPLAYAAAPVVKTIAAPAPAVVAKTVSYGVGAPVLSAYAAPAAYGYDWAPKPYAFGYQYGAASPALAYAHGPAPVAYNW